MTSRLYDASLMERKRTEIAAAKTSSVADQAEFDFRNSRDATIFLVRRMLSPHVRIAVCLVHLLLGKRL